MSKQQYDISKQTNYLKRKMFLDGVVTVQRFEEFRQPKIARYEELQRGFFGFLKKLVSLKIKWTTKMQVTQLNTSLPATY